MKGGFEELNAKLEAATEGLPSVTRKRVFGRNTFFVDGKLFALVWREGRLGLKLPDASAHHELAALVGTNPWIAWGRPMVGWLLVPSEMHEQPALLARWTQRACEAVKARHLPDPKPPIASAPAASVSMASPPRAASSLSASAPPREPILAAPPPAPRDHSIEAATGPTEFDFDAASDLSTAAPPIEVRHPESDAAAPDSRPQALVRATHEESSFSFDGGEPELASPGAKGSDEAALTPGSGSHAESFSFAEQASASGATPTVEEESAPAEFSFGDEEPSSPNVEAPEPEAFDFGEGEPDQPAPPPPPAPSDTSASGKKKKAGKQKRRA